MDIEEFKKTTRPGRWRSKLDPFRDEILGLHQDGYTLAQIVDWLSSAHQVSVTRQALSEFIRRRLTMTKPAGERLVAVTSTRGQGVSPTNGTPLKAQEVTQNGDGTVQDESEDLAGLDSKQRREAVANRYIKDSSNPLLDRKKERKS